MDTDDFFLTPEEDPCMTEAYNHLQASYKLTYGLFRELKVAKKKIVEHLEELERARLENNKLKEDLREKQYEGDQFKRKYVHLKEKYEALEEKNNGLELELRQFKTLYEQKICNNASIQCTPNK